MQMETVIWTMYVPGGREFWDMLIRLLLKQYRRRVKTDLHLERLRKKEVLLAELVQKCVPSMEMMRLVNSGNGSGYERCPCGQGIHRT